MANDAQSALVAKIAAGDTSDPAATPRERALLSYAERLTAAPASINAATIAELRAVGLDDVGIHDACAIVSYFAFVNRIADGLGVELEGTADAE